jgi:hypothetical protein
VLVTKRPREGSACTAAAVKTWCGGAATRTGRPRRRAKSTRRTEDGSFSEQAGGLCFCSLWRCAKVMTLSLPYLLREHRRRRRDWGRRSGRSVGRSGGRVGEYGEMEGRGEAVAVSYAFGPRSAPTAPRYVYI